MNVEGKYLKDEQGNIFSPIVDTNTIYFNGTSRNLSNEINNLRTVILFEGGSTSTINQTIYFTRDSSINYISITYNSGFDSAECTTGLIKIPSITDSIYKIASLPMSLVASENNSDMYHYCAIVYVYSSKIIFNKGAFYQTSTSNNNVYVSGFQSGNSNMYISKVLGYKNVAEPVG